ncbi:cyanobactin biosynthesis system PatB/AcyB/McaB family protein [Anabaena azotica]|uniref:Cyanobactin biosynthesis system PatB/AcyB/McaB family protein n=1 Tax=Anabaena azotica FACHB-119 TaxID=947527 RepID=A0ABR8DG21_9NOST|nr:cyanobactin biosynthesis system PatB/AcyB/McaB family protein [Anabaena azotica]MBD2504683.1 cyanobactin biosynthesis system PatB/AcyB/McaB family protein [Anabaena azotica FACHB-119]
MRLPSLSPPVKRPHFIQPASSVDLEKGRDEDKISILLDLLHGANYNDPAAFQYRSYKQIMTSSMASKWR